MRIPAPRVQLRALLVPVLEPDADGAQTVTASVVAVDLASRAQRDGHRRERPRAPTSVQQRHHEQAPEEAYVQVRAQSADDVDVHIHLSGGSCQRRPDIAAGTVRPSGRVQSVAPSGHSFGDACRCPRSVSTR